MLTEGKFVADRYEILAKTGAGGMSDVYKAKDHVLGRVVAIKVLRQEFADDVNFVTKFRTEAQSAAVLEHPNIVNIYDVGSEEGFHYIVMEYVEGITLKTYIEKKHQLSYKEAVSIAIQVGRGIEAAHNKNIIHRDIKPQNIMISTEGKVKVTDFGIARAATSNTIHSDVMGSVHYSSPEQARNGYLDNRSDIYSLGIVMYEMVTGRVPFDGDTTVAIAIQHLQEEMESPRSIVPDLPVSLEKIILKCTQKSADRRYPSMGDLMEDLKRVLISPDEDFVTMVPPTIQDKTRIISQDDVAQIREETSGIRISNGPEIGRASAPDSEDDEDEDEDDGKGGFLNPKMEKAMTIMGIVAAIIILFIIIYLVGSMLGTFQFSSNSDKDKDKASEPGTVTVSDTHLDSDTDTKEDEDTKPADTGSENEMEEVKMISLLGKELEEAQRELHEIGLKIYKSGEEPSDKYEKGHILSQDIEEGEMVTKNTVVKVTLSSGPPRILVPNVVGNTKEAAEQMLTAASFRVNAAYENSSEAANSVIRQDPQAQTSVQKGTTVTIVVSLGPKQATVPNLSGKTEEDAVKALEEQGLKKGSVDSEYHDTVEEGKVISQTQQPGDSVDIGSAVDFVVSLGKKEVFYQLKNTRIDVTENEEYVVSATITLLDANGAELEKWENVDISSFPYYISYAGDITTSSGTISVVWVLMNEEGEIWEKTSASNVNFTQK